LEGGRGGSVARLLSSPRRRRRLRAAALLLAVAGICAFVGLRYSNTGEELENHFRPGPVQRVAPPLTAAELSTVDQDAVQQIASLFVETAVLRRRVDDSWDITTPNLRQGLSRKEWDSGDIPVTPFPAKAVRAIKYRLDWSGHDLVYLKIAIVPKQTSNVNGQAFDMGLTRTAAAGEHAWLVDYWVPSGLGVAVGGPRAKAVAKEALKQPSSRIPVAWIFLPVGILVALVLGLPLAIFGRQRLRSRRALREYLRERA
jgi:hypothetical protein